MKKIIVLLLCCLFLVACKEEAPSPSSPISYVLIKSSSYTDGDFKYYVEVLDSDHFKEGEEIKIEAYLEYNGDLDEIVISHAASPFYYDIEELTRGYKIGYPMNEPLITTTIKKGERLTSTYRISSGYSAQDEEDYKKFMRQFLSGKFPVGTYAVTGYAKFTVEGENEETKLPATIVFTVEPQ
jgi:hypothetical protein